MSCNGRGILHIQGGHFISSRPGEGGLLYILLVPHNQRTSPFGRDV
jgi:hypothetical protein